MNRILYAIIISFIVIFAPYDLTFAKNTSKNKSDLKPVWQLSKSQNLKQAGLIKSAGTALLVIDFQNFNANKKGFLGGLFDDTNHAISKTKKVIEKARKAGVPIIYLNTVLNKNLLPDTAVFAKLKTTIPWKTLTPSKRNWNFAVIDELKPQPSDFMVIKGSWSNGFRHTQLSDILRALKIRRVVLTGVAEPIAIYGTFLGAWDEGLDSILIVDCILASSTDPKIQNTIHSFSQNIFYPMMGAKVTTSNHVHFI